MMLTTSAQARSAAGSQRTGPASKLNSKSLCLVAAMATLLAALPVVNGQGAISDPRAKICLFDNHRTTVVGSTLYVDGGEWASDIGFFSSNNTAHSVTKWQSASPVPLPFAIRADYDCVWA